MSFRDCLDTAIEGKQIDPRDAERLWKQFQKFRADAQRNGSGLPDAEAKRALEELLAAENAHKRFQARLSLQTAKRIAADIDSYRTGSGQKDIARGARALLVHEDGAPYDSAYGRGKYYVSQAHARMESLLGRFKRSALLGDAVRHNKAQLDLVMRELAGEATGNAEAGEFARIWKDTAEWLRQRFNAAGGAIGKREDWWLPQCHDAKALIKGGLEEWKRQIVPRLALEKMRHPLTDTPLTLADLDEALDAVWQTITTQGWDRREPSRQVFGKGAIANQHGEHRFLVFKSADDWLAYSRDFGGGGDVFAIMMDHISKMSRDIGAMEVLGPNPNATIEWLRQIIVKETETANAGTPPRLAPLVPGTSVKNHANGVANEITNMWADMRGTANTPVNVLFADVMATGRSLVVASKLGGAMLSAVGDIGTSAVTRAFRGIPVKNTFSDMIYALTPEGRSEAVAAGLILDEAAHVFHTQARYVGTMNGAKWAQWLADRTLTLSGLTPWTQGQRHGLGIGVMHEIANQTGNDWATLHPLFRELFEDYGFSGSDWQRMRAVKTHTTPSGVKLFRPVDLAAADETLAKRLYQLLDAETEMAVPSGTPRSRAFFRGNTRPGTLQRELLDSVFMFKSWATLYVMLHGGRLTRLVMAKQPGAKWRGAAYAGALGTTALLMGALSLQLKQVPGGRDPRPMDTPEFWVAAFLQGGGVGLFGDYLFSDLNRYGGGLPSAIGGPMVESAGDLLNLTFGNAWELGVEGKSLDEAKVGREAVNFLRGNVPLGNVWYTRLVWEREFLDQLQWALDPEANTAFKNKQKFWSREFGQEFWFAPGTGAPQRAPDLGKAISAP